MLLPARWKGITIAAVSLVWMGVQRAPAQQRGPAALDTGLPVVPAGVVSRAITWENRTGAVGAGGKEKDGRKGSPAIPRIKNGETITLMDVDGPGVIRHIWITIPDRSPAAMRNMILRMYWDGSEVPSVETPMGDFFGVAHGRTVELTNAYTTMTLGRGFNCFFPMPFGSHAKVTIENDMPDGKDMTPFFFQIDYELRTQLPPNTGRFHVQFRRENPTTEKRDFVILDGAEGPGFFLGCVIGVRPLSGHWWGEGEMKFYMDGDTDFPTICGTGSEDYFCAAWGMGLYQTPYHGCPLYTDPDVTYPHRLISMYRFHEKDPVYFQKSFKATMQQIGWHNGLFERSDDWSSVAFWYQLKPSTRMPPFPDREARTANIVPPRKPETKPAGG